MLQWSFEAVDCDDNFPFGVKTMYRQCIEHLQVTKLGKLLRSASSKQSLRMQSTGNDNGADHDDDDDDIYNSL